MIPDDPWKPFRVGSRVFRISLADRHFQTLWDVTDEKNQIEIETFIGLPAERLTAAIEDYLMRLNKERG